VTVAHKLNPAERADLADRVARARLARQAEDRSIRRNEPTVKPRQPDQHNLKIIAKLEHELRGVRLELQVAQRMLDEARRTPAAPPTSRKPAEDPYKKRYEVALQRNEILVRKLRERDSA